MTAESARLPAGRPRALLVLILLVAAALRVGALDKPFYIDEMTTITVASQPLGEMARVMRLIDASPALYPLLLHGWIEISHADAWVRLLSALFGWLAVAVVWRLATRVFGWRTGLVAAAVMAIAPAQVHYAQYVRNYSLFTLLAAAHVWLFVDWIDPAGRRTRGRFAWLTLATAALLYTHYLSLLLFPVEGLVALGAWRSRRRAVLGWAAAMAIAGVLFLPGVPLLLHNMAFDAVRNEQRPAPPPVTDLLPTLVAELSVGQRALGFDDARVQRTVLVAAVIVLPGLALVGFARGLREDPERTLLLAAMTVLPIAVYIGTGRRLVAVRFFVPFMAGYVVLIGHGLASLRRGAAVAAGGLVVLLCAVPLTYFFTTYAWSYDHRRVARAIGQAAEPGDALFVVHPFETFYYRWYLDDTMPMQGLTFTALEEQEAYVIKPPPLDLDRAESRIRAAAGTHPRLWIVGQSTKSFASDADAEGQLFAWLDAHARRLADFDALTDGDPHIRLYDVRTAFGSATAR